MRDPIIAECIDSSSASSTRPRARVPDRRRGGQRLFEAGTEIPALDPVESRAFRSGIVLTRYRPRVTH